MTAACPDSALSSRVRGAINASTTTEKGNAMTTDRVQCANRWPSEPHMPADADLSDAPKDARAKVTTHTTGHSEQRTAIEVTSGDVVKPIMFVDPDGNVLFQLNVLAYDDGRVIAHVIDVEHQFNNKRTHIDKADDFVWVDLRNAE